MKVSWLMTGLGAVTLSSFAAAAEQAPPPQPDPAIKAFLECINTEAQKQITEGSDKITNAQTVIDACADKKQALLNAINPTLA